MAGADYIPAGSKLFRQLRRDRDVVRSQHETQRQQERDEAEKKAIEAIEELGRLGVQMVQFEVVKPLGRLAALSKKLNPLLVKNIIRADTIRRYGSTYDYAQRHALLIPRKGYLMPVTDESQESRLQEALFPDGTTGTIMRWDRYEKGFAAYIGFSPPSEAYWCDESGSVKFSPCDTDDRFEARNCLPVWGGSLMSLSDDKWGSSIDSLTGRIYQLAVLSQAQQIVDQT